MPDISFDAALHADEVRFGRCPEARVTFHGTPGHASRSASRRRHLPERVAAGTDYHDVAVRYALATGLAPEPREARRTDADGRGDAGLDAGLEGEAGAS
ncbi:hypothetical protein RM844_17270 [Streptomyces sp. DSM 44915]|uniref:Uncharacterized protein n=1 Tax=Streptomyces chisholmiae TaxID=3075540 RepID=A0ABU2JSR9_9ACTN|nr:hypothetical protein [Streptomyces sp. DSM 44915]MDT0268034.1 hypothetical protein [Streptomyces sp. DSM 44915]